MSPHLESWELRASVISLFPSSHSSYEIRTRLNYTFVKQVRLGLASYDVAIEGGCSKAPRRNINNASCRLQVVILDKTERLLARESVFLL